jgi:hypothetical protein
MSNTTINEVEINGKTYILKDNLNFKNQESLPVVQGTPFRIGANYLIRTITMIYTGKLEEVYEKELVLSTCAWIADTGRWTQAVEKGTFSEVEPYPNKTVIINREVVLDACLIDFPLPTKQA